MRATSAIILAAGQGTRMKSKYPKVMAEVLFKPMINWVTDWCLKAGIEKICVVVGSGADQVRAALPQQCVTVEQTERLGTGHAVMMAKEFIREHPGDVVVLNGDAPFVSDQVIGSALEHHRQSGAQVTVVTARLHDPSGYGRILRENGRVTGIVEDRDATGEQKQIAEVNSGAYCFESGFLLEALEQLTCRNSQGEYYLTDTVQVAFQQGKKVEACLCEDEKLVLGANDRAGLLKLNEIANKIVVDRLLEDGVNFYCTDGVVISPDAVVGRDTTIAPGTQLRGHVVIGEDCVIGPNTIIENSRIGDGCQIHSSLIEQSQVGSGVPQQPPAPEQRAGRPGQDRQLCRDQKFHPGSKDQRGAPDLHRRLRLWGKYQRRLRRGDGQLQRLPQVPQHRRRQRLHRLQHKPGFPGPCRGKRLHRGGLHHHRRRAGRRPCHRPGPPGGKGRLGGRLPGKGACAQRKGKERKEVKVVSYSRRLRQGRTAV